MHSPYSPAFFIYCITFSHLKSTTLGIRTLELFTSSVRRSAVEILLSSPPDNHHIPGFHLKESRNPSSTSPDRSAKHSGILSRPLLRGGTRSLQNSPYLSPNQPLYSSQNGVWVALCPYYATRPRSPFAPTHLFHHCSPLVLLPELGGRSAHDLPILIGSAQVCTSSFPPPGGSFGPKSLAFASPEVKPSFESRHEFLVESSGVVGFGKNRKTRSFFTNRLRLQTKHMGNFMDEPSLSLLQWR